LPSRLFSRPRGAPVRAVGALLLFAVAALAACTEDFDSSEACPLLCPPQSVQLRDTLVEGVVFDTALSGFPGLGAANALYLGQSGDSLDTRVIIRFDQLPTRFISGGVDSAITRVDTATLSLRLAFPLLASATPLEVEAYDVDTTATDTLPQTLLPLFRPDRLIGSTFLTPASAPDSTFRMFLDTGFVRRVIADSARLRIGLRLREGTSGQVYFLSVESGVDPILSLRVSPDTTVAPLTVATLSTTPEGPSFPATQLRDYIVIARQTATAPPSALALGGLGGSRSMLRFDLPAHIVDSSTVVRATLDLTQFPYRGFGSGDTLSVFAHLTLGTQTVTDLRRMFTLLSAPAGDTLRIVAADSGQRSMELAGLIAAWRNAGTEGQVRAIILRVPTEGLLPAEVRFFSREAPEALRPRLRLIYVPRTTIGQP